MNQQSSNEFGFLGISTRMQQLGDRLRKGATRIYKEEGIDFESRWFPVVFLLMKEGPMGVMEIADRLGFAHPTVVITVRELKKKKLISSIQDKTDGRKKLLSLSKKGTEHVELMKPLWDRFAEVNALLCDNTHNLLLAIEAVEIKLNQKSMHQRMIEKKHEHQDTNI